MGLIGLSQFVGNDFFETAIGRRLVLGDMPAEFTGELEGAFEIAYGTLYNPNPFGKYTAMVAPILLACALVYKRKGWQGILVRLAFLAGGGLMLVGVFGSRSLAGFVALAAAIGVTALTFVCRAVYQAFEKRKVQEETEEKRSLKGWVIAAAAVLGLCVVLYFVPPINQRVNLAVERLNEAVFAEPEGISDLVFDGNSFTMITGGQERFTLVLEPQPGSDGIVADIESWRIYDSTGQYVPVSSRVPAPASDEVFIYTHAVPGFGNVAIERHSNVIFFRNLVMVLHDERIHAISPAQTFIDLSEPVAASGFVGRESWGSNRGYIWSRTFPLLPSRVIIGSGPDAYVQVFPQHDVVGKLFFTPNPYTPIDKAHNLYLQTWVNTGGISAFALLFLFGFYLFTAFMATIRSSLKEGMFLFGLRFGLLAGISAFVIASLSTDSTIGTSSVFFVLLGLGYGINMVVAKMNRGEIANAA